MIFPESYTSLHLLSAGALTDFVMYHLLKDAQHTDLEDRDNISLGSDGQSAYYLAGKISFLFRDVPYNLCMCHVAPFAWPRERQGRGR